MQSALRDDALATTGSGFSLRIGLPWIRSLPLACLREPAVALDGQPVPDVRVAVGPHLRTADELLEDTAWWFAQDRVVLVGEASVDPGWHDVVVTFQLLVPYLMAGPGGGALELPMRLSGRLELDHPEVPSVSLDVA